MYLFFDTETTGLPKKYNAPASDSENWPRLVQLAWLQYNENEQLEQTGNLIIKPVDFEIPQEATNIHGITTEKAVNEGINLIDALLEFNDIVHQSTILIAHNISFDEKIIEAEYLRCHPVANLSEIKKICTKNASTNYCKIPGRYGYKWPSLMELHELLFDIQFEDAHDALVDVKACAKCFFELKKRNVITIR